MISEVINKRAGIAGGMFMSILPNLTIGDIVRTIILGAIGTLVSYCLTLLFQRITRKIHRAFTPRQKRNSTQKKKEKKKAI